MFGFGKSKNAAKPVSRQQADSNPTDDLLALSEEEEFAASEQQARERARQRQGQPPAPAVKQVEDDIDWNEQQDVYRPTDADAAEYLARLMPGRPVTLKQGNSIILTRQAAFEKIQTHLRSNLKIELGGLVIGKVVQDTARALYLVIVEDALPAVGGTGTAISFEYTSESWQSLTPQLQQMSADQTIVGSYHSHPGLGVFMSSTDRDTQSDIFDHAWQIALVIDPIREQVGFFISVSATPCPDWYLF